MFEKRYLTVPYPIGSIDSSPCGRFIACAADRIVATFDLIELIEIAQGAEVHTEEIVMVKYSWNGNMIASGSHDHSVIIWNSATLEQIGRILEGHQECVWTCSFSPDDQYLISGSFDNSIRIWSCYRKVQFAKICVNNKVYSVCYSLNGQQIMITGESNDIVIRDSKTKKQLYKLIGHASQVHAARYSQNGKLIISCSTNNQIRVWNAVSGQYIESYLIRHELFITSLGFHPDCSQIVYASEDGTITLWNFITSSQYILAANLESISGIKFSSNGKYVFLRL